MSADDRVKLPPILLEKDVYEFLKATWKGDSEVEDEDDQENERFFTLLQQLGTPPTFTTLRLNTLSTDKQEIIQQLKAELEKQYEEKGSTAPPIVLHPALKDVVVIPSRGPNDKPVQVTKEVIVDLDCGMAVLRGADVFVLGIMGAPSDVNTGDLVAVYADLDGQCRKGFKEEYKERKIYVGCGEMQLSRNQIFCSAQVKLRGVGIKMTHPLYEAPSLDDVLPDLIFAQNLPSIVCSLVLDPQPGETVIDMCASPGGKTNHIASLMNDQGRVVALDKNPLKVEKVVKNIKRWGLTSVESYAFDSTKSVDENADIEGVPPYPAESFDRVLLDVPCSALGQRPSSRNKITLKSLHSYPSYQKRFIEATKLPPTNGVIIVRLCGQAAGSLGVELLKPGGTLVYSTCTITLEENEKQVRWMLDKYPSLSLVKQEPHLGEIGRPCQGLSHEQLELIQRFDPSSTTSKSKHFTDTDTIGFFIAKFVKQSAS